MQGTTDRIRYRRVNERTGEEVPYENIVKGYELGGGDYVILTPDELDAAAPGRSRTIEISDFVDIDEIDPVYYQKTYYLAPQRDGAERAYGLLRQALLTADKVGIATFVMRSKEYLVAIRPEDEVLVLETMFFADEVRDAAEEIEQLPTNHDFSNRELTMARQLIESMASDWEPTRYHDSYREELEVIIERKRQGEDVVTEGPPAQDTNVVDLMEALRRSVDASRRGRAGSGGGSNADSAATTKDLTQLTKKQLTKRAADLDIRGRSSMTKDKLIRAIREHLADERRAS